ncbi:MAG: polymer-forming cytoskeletal protein [Alphaproteobacteria bacterium]|nr:polymer-forming cytoskeletal protein [Alphaproteobacteria bacterium]
MFGRKDMTEETEVAQAQDTATQSPASPRSPMGDAARMPSASPLPGRRPEHRRSHPVDRDRGLMGGEDRKLTVGKGLSLTGEISACDILVVEGKVEAKLSDGKLLEITESGQFRGTVEIENADIAGRYDGELTVHGRLTIRGTGRITGIIKYGELEVNAGGQIIGEMQVVGGGAASASGSSAPSFKSAAKFTAATEEDEDNALFSRKTASNG